MDTIKMLSGHKIIGFKKYEYGDFDLHDDGDEKYVVLEMETDLAFVRFYHERECCESVWFESSDTPLEDLIGSIIIDANSYDGETKDYLEFHYYRIITNNYTAVLDFRGNQDSGYYTTDVNVVIEYKDKFQFWHYYQNNSGGVWGNPAREVWIFAKDAKMADYFADEIGIYFDGCNRGHDCECCGDRWYHTWNGCNYVEINMFPKWHTRWNTTAYAIYYPSVDRIVKYHEDKTITVERV